MREERTVVTRRRLLGGALSVAASLPVLTRRAGAQAKPTISYWNGLTGADGKVMDELIDQFTRETGIKVEQQRIQWADLYAKLQVSVPAGEGPDLVLFHSVVVPQFANDGIVEPIDQGVLAAKGFQGEDYIASTWQGGIFQGKRYAIPLDVPQHILSEFWGSFHAHHKVAPPANTNPRDAFIAGRLGIWLAGSWNFTGLREAKVDFTVAPVPRLLKQPVVWTIPHQYALPKPKAPDTARREAVWTHVRWMSDHVAEWTLKAGQVSALRKAHADPRITADPVLRTLLAQAPNWQAGQPTPKWVAAENLTRPVIETVYIGQKPARAAMEDLAKQINAMPD